MIILKQIHNMQEMNDTYCMWLDLKGCKSELLKANIQERKKLELSPMENHTKESVEDLAKATTHGNKSLVTCGRHYTHGDALKSAYIEAKNRDVKIMKEEKTCALVKKRPKRMRWLLLNQNFPLIL